MGGVRITRRRFLEGLGAGALGLGVAEGIDQWVTRAPSDAAEPDRLRRTARYRSAPDLRPPLLDVTRASLGTAGGFLFLAPKGGPGQYGPMIADDHGQPVWFRGISGPFAGTRAERLQEAEVANNFRVSRYKGRPVLTWWQGQVGHGASRYVVVDDRYRQIESLRAGNGLRGDEHEFVIAPDDTALVTVTRSVPADLSPVGGPSQGTVLDGGFQRLDVATGDVLFQWMASDHVSFWESYRPIDGQGTRSAPWDFFHVNSVDVDTDGNYLVSARHTWAVYKIDRATGAVIWRLNGKRSDFRVEPKARFSWQHDARHHGGGVLSLFDDGAGVYRSAPRSRGLILSLDVPTMTARVAEEYVLPGHVLSWSQGSVQTLPNGNVLVGWGSEPYVSEYTHDGRLLLSARLPARCESYRAFRFPWTGRPLSPPAVAIERGSGTAHVYMSWNGATSVTAWQVLGGARHEDLRPIGRARSTGFETFARVTTSPTERCFAAVALDARARVVGRSETVRRP
ncbi:MAG: arylsulfotransferase family protein [Acidimicrobiales bacterium]